MLFSDSASSAVSAVLRCERQAVSTAERAELRGEGNGADEEPRCLCFGAIGLGSRFHREALDYCSVTLVADGGQVTEPVEGGWTNSFDGNETVKRTERTVCHAIRDDASREHVADAR